jgi:NTP pyrophosphatase (non-canonical NTP hydrolase)
MLSIPMYILQGAINTFGIDSQLDMAIEEMSELTKEICKFKRNEKCSRYESLDALAEEMADVIIMIEQLKIIFSNNFTVDVWVNRKMKRLEQLVSEKQKVGVDNA